MAAAAAEFGAQKTEDLLAQIGYGKVSARQLLDKLVPEGQLKEKAPEHPVLSAMKRVLKPGSGEADRIKVRGADDLMVFRARCCNPIRGEQIVGYITRGKGVSVHAAQLPQRRQPACTTRSAASTSSGTRAATPRPTRCG